MTQRRRFKIIIYSILLIAAIGSYVWWLNFNWAKERDYDRIADMRALQSELLIYYSKFNTFRIPGCSDGMLINFCQGNDKQSVGVESLVDPLNVGSYQYAVDQLLDNDFRISFAIETSLPNMPPGKYIITKSAIVR